MRPAHTPRLLAATMRLTRLIVADDVPGQWWIKEPLTAHAQRHQHTHGAPPSWWRYTEGLDCPFCVGLWIAAAVAVADHAIGHTTPWKLATTALALNEVAAHLAVRVGDTGSED